MLKLRQYDVGAILALPVRDQDDQIIDLDGSETATIYLEAPSGRVKERAATIDGATDTVLYTTQAYDLDEWASSAKPWRIQARLENTSGLDVSTTILLFEVEPVLRSPVLVIDARAIPSSVFVPEPSLSFT